MNIFTRISEKEEKLIAEIEAYFEAKALELKKDIDDRFKVLALSEKTEVPANTPEKE